MENKNRVFNENYITIQGFMVKELQLKGTELLIYALIYGFSQDGQSEFAGSRTYICEWFNISLPTVDKALDNLVKKGLISKRQEDINGVIFNRYKIIWGVVKKLYGGSKETLHNNNIYNISNNSNINIIEDINNNIINNIQKEEINKEEKDIFSYIEENYGRTLSPIEYEEIMTWEDNELTRYAIKQSILMGVYNIKYIATILQNFEKQSIKTVQQAQEIEKKFREKNNKVMSASEKRQEMYKRLEEKYKDDN